MRAPSNPWVIIFVPLLLWRSCLMAVGSGLPPMCPPWLKVAIETDNKSEHPGSFEEVAYQGKRGFLYARGGISDAPDQFTLFSEDGKEICKFGGYEGRVTSGTCIIGKIVTVRLL